MNWIVTLAILIGAVVAIPATAADTMKEPAAHRNPYEIRLLTRRFTPQPGMAYDLANRLSSAVERGARPHVYVQLAAIPSAIERLALQTKGLRLLRYVGSSTWQATLTTADALTLVEAPKVESRAHPAVRWIGAIEAGDKLARELGDKRRTAAARTAENRLPVVIHLFSDVPVEVGRNLLAKTEARIVGIPPTGNRIVAEVPESQLDTLAASDAIAWIGLVPPPGAAEANRARAYLQVNAAQAAGWDGAGVRVGVFEDAHTSDIHPDLAGRVTKGDADPWDRQWHATMSGGFIAGDGSALAGALRRGMAPAADLFTFDFWIGAGATWAGAYLNFLGDLQASVDIHNVSIANNSWGTTGGCGVIAYGDYSELSDDLDNAVRGTGYEHPVVVVFSAGNERNGYIAGGAVHTDCLTTEVVPPFRNYGTLNHPKSAKNILVIGGVDSANDRMWGGGFDEGDPGDATDDAWWGGSSWGPTGDGRIKPDLVGPAVHDGPNHALNPQMSLLAAADDYYLAPYYPHADGDYGYFAQTSAAAAAASGTVAQLVQAYRTLMATPTDPLPSTVRATLVQSARDLSDGTSWYNPGPDYASGYGLLQIADAIGLINTRQVLEGKVSLARPDRYTVSVPAGTPELKVTLAWDDPPPAPAAADILVNDLDLVVRAPTGTIHRPWTLDPANPDTAAVRTQPDRHNNLEQVVVDVPVAGTWTIEIGDHLLPEGPQRYSLVASQTIVGQVDAVQVLDRSGSMTGTASPGMPDSKIETLRSAASHFVDMMQPDVGNRLGLVQFNADLVPFPAGSEDALAALTTARAGVLTSTTIPGISAGGRTSIGDGLRQALDQLLAVPAPDAHDRVVLLVSDGMENEPEWIATVQPDLVANDVIVYALGLGHGAGINEAKLQDLATDTDGTYRITADHLVFRKLFLEALAGAVDWTVVADPVLRLGPGQSHTVPFTLAADDLTATVTAYWEGASNVVAMELVTPSGRAISPATDNRFVRYREHPRYAFYQLDFPLAATLADDHAGTWQIKLTGDSRLEKSEPVLVTTTVFAEEGVELAMSLDRPNYFTADPIGVRATLTRAGRPVLGATVQVLADVPLIGAGNLLRKPSVARDPKQMAGDPVDRIQGKLELLAAHGAVLKRGESTVRLFDDGRHHDGKRDDGIYGALFDATKIPGSYSFRAQASKIPAGRGQSTTREASLATFVGVRIDPAHSTIELQHKSQGTAVAFELLLEPMDAHDNYLGPGHSIDGVLHIARRKVPVTFHDHVDGRYTARFTVPRRELFERARMDIRVDGRRFISLPTLNDGTGYKPRKPPIPR